MKKLLPLIILLSSLASAQFVSQDVITPTASGATVTFTSCGPATSTVSFGLTTAYGSTLADMTAVASHSFALSGLTGATTYHFKVSSADGSGNVVTSPDQTFTTAAGSVQAVSISPPSLSFPNATVGTASAVQYATISASSGSVTISKSFTISGSTEFKFGGSGTCKVGQILASGQSCTAGIAFTATSTGAHSGALSINDSAPGSPQTVPLSGTIKGTTLPPPTHKASLSWTPSTSSVDGYIVLRAPAGGAYATLATLGAVSSYVDSSVIAGQSYSYEVEAFTSAGGDSAASNAATAVIPTP